MFGWGKSRGASRRAYDNNVIIVKDEDCAEPEGDGDKSSSTKHKPPEKDGKPPKDKDTLIYRCSPLQLGISIAFAIGMTVVLGGVAIALSFAAGGQAPEKIAVKHITEPCMLGALGTDDPREIARIIEAQKDSDESDKSGSAVTIFVPCPVSNNTDYNSERGRR